RLNGRTADASAALQEAAQRLSEISRRHGLEAVACIGSLRSSLETQGALACMCRVKRWPPPVFFDDDQQLAAIHTAVAGGSSELHVSMRAVESADALLLVGCDPIQEAPMLAMALRQAQRQGAAVICIDPRPVDLPLEFRHIPVSIDQTAVWLSELTRRITVPDGGPAGVPGHAEESADLLMETAQTLVRSRRPVIVCGTDAVDKAAVAQSRVLARALNTAGRRAGLFAILPGAGAFAAALMSEAGRSIAQVVAGIEQGQIKGLLVVETDPFWRAGDRQRLASALARLELKVVMDYLEGPHSRDADVFLPSTTVFESGGTFVNQEGRAQRAFASFAGGIPIRITGAGDHPPRVYDLGLPGADPLPAWHMLSVLAEEGGFASSADILSWLADQMPGFGALAQSDLLPSEGLLLSARAAADTLARSQAPAGSEDRPQRQAGTLDLITHELTFGSEELSCRSLQLIELEPPPRAGLSAADAQRLKLKEGDRIAIDAGAGDIEVELTVSDRIAPGVLLVPRHHRLDWQRLGNRRVHLSPDRIRKVKAQ
ncbi:MAG: hypothetical protein C4519_05605, partial [Desulfobacteraceae bacterium]